MKEDQERTIRRPQVPSTRSFWETCTNCGLTPTHEMILTNINREREEGWEWVAWVTVLQNMMYGSMYHYPGRNSELVPITHNVQCFLIQDYPWSCLCWTNTRRVANVMLSRTRTMRCLNRIRKSESRTRVNALSHDKSNQRTVLILSRHHNTQICGPSSCPEPPDIQIAEARPMRGRHGDQLTNQRPLFIRRKRSFYGAAF